MVLVALHLVPGALATLVFIATEPLVVRLGFPVLLALYGPMSLTVVVLEGGFLLAQGRLTPEYRSPLPVWQTVALAVACVLIGALLTVVASPIDMLMLSGLAGWLPRTFLLLFTDPSRLIVGVASREAALFTVIVGLVMNGLIGPIVEELYFRGYLLPRLSALGRAAPLANAALFSLYHFWAPWQFVSRLLTVLPFIYAVWWRRNVVIGIVTHCTLNLIGTSVIAVLLLGRP